MTKNRKLAEYIEPNLGDAELGAQWGRIEARLGAPRSLPRGGLVLAGVLSFAALVALVVFVVIRKPTATASAWDGAVLESGADRVSVALGDGSSIDLAPASRILVHEGTARAVHLEMPKGGAHFSVTHVPGRAFDVTAAGVVVHVVGTKFSVTTSPEGADTRVTVSVEQGAVEAEARAGGERTRIAAGETWSTVKRAPSAPTDSASLAAGAAPPQGETATDTSNPKNLESEKNTAAPSSSSPSLPRSTAEPTAQELFEKGNLARQSGDARGAATAYEALLKRHPSDARAGLAAFELGRVRMDQLGDLRGAVSALERASTSAPGFREDALARLVRAYASLGDSARCERTAKTYLASYPNGVHAGAVRNACGGS
jgi:TolA-binding protein